MRVRGMCETWAVILLAMHTERSHRRGICPASSLMLVRLEFSFRNLFNYSGKFLFPNVSNVFPLKSELVWGISVCEDGQKSKHKMDEERVPLKITVLRYGPHDPA